MISMDYFICLRAGVEHNYIVTCALLIFGICLYVSASTFIIFVTSILCLHYVIHHTWLRVLVKWNSEWKTDFLGLLSVSVNVVICPPYMITILYSLFFPFFLFGRCTRLRSCEREGRAPRSWTFLRRLESFFFLKVVKIYRFH